MTTKSLKTAHAVFIHLIFLLSTTFIFVNFCHVRLSVGYFSALGLLILIAFRRRRKYVASFILSFILFIFLTYLANQQLIGYDGFLAIFQSDPTESWDFVLDNIHYPRKLFFLIILFFSMVTALQVFFTERLGSLFTKRSFSITLVIFTLAGAYPIYRLNKRLSESLIQSYQIFQKEKTSFEKDNVSFDQMFSEPARNPLNLVILLGESTSKWSINYYGYPRLTFSALDSYKDDIIFYSDAISPHSHTSPTISQILTAEKLSPFKKRQSNASLIQILNNSKVETHWYSTQNKFGFWENPVTRHALLSKHHHFYRKTFGENYQNRFFDHRLFPFFERDLQGSPSDRNLFLIHTYAGHGSYCGNIPEKYHIPFNDIFDRLSDKSLWGSFAAPNREQLNCYDNAVRYIADNIKHLIQVTERNPQPTIFVYFPDHGEDVWNNSSHGSANHSHKHVEIPLLWYFNAQAKKQYPHYFENLNQHKDLPVNTANISNDILNMFGIKTVAYNPELSISTDQYKPEDRYLFLTPDDPFFLSYDNAKTPPVDSRNIPDMRDLYEKTRISLKNTHKSDTKYCIQSVNSVFKYLEVSSLVKCIQVDITATDDIYVGTPQKHELKLSDFLQVISFNEDIYLNLHDLNQTQKQKVQSLLAELKNDKREKLHILEGTLPPGTQLIDYKSLYDL